MLVGSGLYVLGCLIMENGMRTLNRFLCGACVAAVTIGAANAGQLVAAIEDVNFGDPNEMDENLDGDPIAVLLGTGTNENTVEAVANPLVGLQLTSELQYDLGIGKYVPIHFEVDVDDVDDFRTFSGDQPYVVEIQLDGPVEWKKTFSPAEIIRYGSDEQSGNPDGYSESAEGFNGAQIQIGDDFARFLLTPNEFSEEAIGFILPVRVTGCAPTSVRFSFELLNSGSVRTVPEEGKPALPLTTCDPDKPAATGDVLAHDVEIDVGTMGNFFETILIPRGIGDKGRDPARMRTFGMVTMNIHGSIFNPKEKWLDGNLDRIVDETDIDSYTLALDLEKNYSGYEIDLVDADGNFCETFDPVIGNPQRVQVTLNRAETLACFDFVEDIPGDATTGEGRKSSGMAVLKIRSTGEAPIEEQNVTVAVNEIDWETTIGQNGVTENVMFDNPTVLTLGQQFRIIRAGLVFGPFDWTTASDGNGARPVVSNFRFTRVSEVEDVYSTGIVLVENTPDGSDGRCTFDLKDMPANTALSNGEITVTGERLGSLVSVAENCVRQVAAGEKDGKPLYDYVPGALNANFRGDVTWILFCPIDKCDKTDVDRLLNNRSNGTFADYGDNGNDANSVKARSCDPGRFGPHTTNVLNSRQSNLALLLCQADFARR